MGDVTNKHSYLTSHTHVHRGIISADLTEFVTIGRMGDPVLTQGPQADIND
jgi:hypothetical protein